MRPFPNSLAIVILTACFASTSTAYSTMSAAEPAPKVSGVYGESQVTKTATVEKIDLAKRLVTLKNEKGDVFTIKAGDEVKNLPQLKVGDTVSATYYESVAYDVWKPGSPDVAVGSKSATGVSSAKPGEKPAAAVADVTKVTATIVSIDKATPSITLRRPDGEVVAVRVKDPAKLEKVAVGDLIEVTYTQAVAVVVQPTAPAAK